MSKQTAASLFILPPSEAKSAELYQALLHGIESYQQLGQRLIRLAEQAHAFRQFDKVKEMALMLSNIPIRSYQAIGHYFLAIATHRVANGNWDEAKRLFELAVDTAPDAYRVKATLSLGALSMRRNDFDSTLYYYRETIKAGKLSAASLIATRGIATVKSIEGDHRSAIADLEQVMPVMKYAPAHIYFDVLNSYAVELGEVGRKDEARNVMRVVLASPFAQAYPEWRETAEELKPSRRSFVAVGSPSFNVFAMPEREPSKRRTFEPIPARVLDLAKWKKKMTKKERDDKKGDKGINRDDPERYGDIPLADMSASDMAMRLLEIITENRADEHHMRKILEYAEKVFSEPSQPDPDKPAS
jgi:tetratricopeptide (TPR) repeat protein